MIFEGKRAEILHRYEVREDALYYRAGTATEYSIPWRDFTRLQRAQGEAIFFVAKKHQPIAIWLAPREMKAFLSAALEAWRKQDRGAAMKAAFDYGSDDKSIGWIWLVLSLAFPGLLALTLLSDAFHTMNCNRLLETGGQIASAKVLKVKKNRRGNFIWQLEFKTEDGSTVEGTREAIVHEENGNPNGEPTVVYSPDNLKCWDLSLRAGEKALDRNQRHFTLLMAMSFGWIFALVAAVCIRASVLRIVRKNPYRNVVGAVFKG